jgi:hypothetical protein
MNIFIIGLVIIILYQVFVRSISGYCYVWKNNRFQRCKTNSISAGSGISFPEISSSGNSVSGLSSGIKIPGFV